MGACNGQIPITQDTPFSLCQAELSLQSHFSAQMSKTMINTNSQQIFYYLSNKWKKSLQNVSGTGIIYKSQSFLYSGNVQNGFPKGRGKLFWINQSLGNITIKKYSKNPQKPEKKQQQTLQFGKFEGVWSQNQLQSGKYYPNANQTQKYILLHSLALQHQPQKLQNPQSNNKILVQIQLPDKSFYKGEMTLNKEKGIYMIDGFGQLIYPYHSEQNNPPHSYIGQWKQNKMHGQGTFTWKNGQKYTGGYQGGVKHGQGKFYQSDKDYVQAKWVLGKKEGTGAQYKNGTKRYISWSADVEIN